jgi:hypothetical protein
MFHDKPGFQAVGGITRSGQFDDQDRRTGENFTREGQRLYDMDRGQAGNGANAIEAAANRAPLGTGDGTSAGNAKTSSSGGEWVNVEPSATRGAATAPSPQASAGNDTPARKAGESEFAYNERMARARGQADGAFGGSGNTVRDLISGFRADKSAKDEIAARADGLRFANEGAIGRDELSIEGFGDVQKEAYRSLPRAEQRKALDEIQRKKEARERGEIDPNGSLAKANKVGESVKKDFASSNQNAFDDFERVFSSASDYDKLDPKNKNRVILDYNESLKTGKKFNIPDDAPSDLKSSLDASFSDFVSSQVLKNKARIDEDSFVKTKDRIGMAAIDRARKNLEDEPKGYFSRDNASLSEKRKILKSTIAAYNQNSKPSSAARL